MNHINISLKSEYSGTEKKEIHFYVNLTIDGASPITSHDDAFDLFELFQSNKEDGIHFIFTCDCGVPGCAGYFKGIKVTTNDTITWENLDNDKMYVFSSSQIKDEIAKCQNEILALKEDADARGMELKVFPCETPVALLLKIF